jgi:thiol-disulfide isomerase/thioredoxin
MNIKHEMELINSDKVDWAKLFMDNDYIIVNYQAQTECPGCEEMTKLFETLSEHEDFEDVKFLWVDSRQNAIAEQFIKKRQVPFIAAFKKGFLVECENISDEAGLRAMINRLFNFKFKL